MENFSFGNDFVALILLIGWITSIICVLFALLVVHFLSSIMVDKMAKWLRITNDNAGKLVAYELCWILIMPAVFTFLTITLPSFRPLMIAFEQMQPLDQLIYLLFSLTLWEYNTQLSMVQQKPLGKIIQQAIVFITLNYILSVLMALGTSRNYAANTIFPRFIKTLMLTGLALWYIRRNKVENKA